MSPQTFQVPTAMEVKKVIMPRFGVGARWDQVIYVAEGEGRIQLKGGEVSAITPVTW